MATTQLQWLLRGVLPALKERCGISYTVEQSKHIKVKLFDGSGATGNVTVSSTPSGNLRKVRLNVLGDFRREVIQRFGLESIRFGSLSSYPLEDIVSVSGNVARLQREWDEFCDQLLNLPADSRRHTTAVTKQRQTRRTTPPPAKPVSAEPAHPKMQFGRFRQIPEED